MELGRGWEKKKILLTAYILGCLTDLPKERT